MYDQNLSAAQRGYKQHGKKLRPRDAYDAMLRDEHKFRNVREMRKAMVEYNKPRYDESPHIRRMNNALAKLNTRDRRKVEDALEMRSLGVARHFDSRAMQRAYDRVVEAESIERYIQADANGRRLYR